MSWRSRKDEDETREALEAVAALESEGQEEFSSTEKLFDALDAALDSERGCGDGDCCKDVSAPVAVLQLDETECVGISRAGFALVAATGGSLSAVIDGGRVLLTVYRDDSLRHIRLDADQVEMLRRWLKENS